MCVFIMKANDRLPSLIQIGWSVLTTNVQIFFKLRFKHIHSLKLDSKLRFKHIHSLKLDSKVLRKGILHVSSLFLSLALGALDHSHAN